jgi:TetR/AcrR family transcriptional repressor of nem operon
VLGRPRAFDPDQVLDRAMAVFWRKGFEGTGLVDLEQATGLGRQSLYGAFGDKQALFGRVVEHYFERVLRPGLIDVLDAPGSARANLERLFARWEAAAAAPDFQGCLVGNAVSDLTVRDDALAEVLRRKLRLLEEALCRALRRAQSDGEISPRLDARATARALLTLAQGLAVVGKVQREPAFVRAVVGSARRLLD